MLWAISYVVGVLVQAFPELEAGTGDHDDRTGYCRAHLVLPEPDPYLEPSGTQDQFQDHKRLQRGDYGRKTVKSLVVEEKNFGEFSAVTEEMRSASIKAARLNAIYIPMVAFFGFLATALVLDRGGIMVLDGRLDLGTLAAFTAYAVGIFEPIQRLAEF